MTTSKAGSIVSACQQNILSRFQQPNPESFANPHLHTCGHCGIATHRAALGALGNNRTFWVGLLDLQSKSVHAPPPPSLFLWLTWTQMGWPEGCRLGHRSTCLRRRELQICELLLLRAHDESVDCLHNHACCSF